MQTDTQAAGLGLKGRTLCRARLVPRPQHAQAGTARCTMPTPRDPTPSTERTFSGPGFRGELQSPHLLFLGPPPPTCGFRVCSRSHLPAEGSRASPCVCSGGWALTSSVADKRLWAPGRWAVGLSSRLHPLCGADLGHPGERAVRGHDRQGEAAAVVPAHGGGLPGPTLRQLHHQLARRSPLQRHHPPAQVRRQGSESSLWPGHLGAAHLGDCKQVRARRVAEGRFPLTGTHCPRG